MFGRTALVVGVGVSLAACQGESGRDGPPVESSGGAGGASGNGGISGSGSASGNGGTSGSGGASGNGGTSGSGGASGNGGTSGSGGGDAATYSAVLTNGTGCCDYYTISRADPASNTCVFFSVVVEGGGSLTTPTVASAFAGIDHCCPSDSLFAISCAGGMGCPTTSSIRGAISLDAAGFDIDLALQFEPQSWLPETIEFRTENLGRSTCVVPTGT